VAQPTDDSNATILPEPELNPLLNPLLAAHMGRWAEVYFTSPPAKRAQAVSDLVRELANHPTPEPALNSRARSDDRSWRRGNEGSGKESAKNSTHEHQDANFEVTEQESTINNSPISLENAREAMVGETTISEAMASEVVVHEPTACESCGHVNAPQQRFCGMCGTPLASPPENSEPRFAEPEASAPASWDEPDKYLSWAREGDRESEVETAAELPPESEQEPQDQSWSRAGDHPAEDTPHFSVLSDYQSEPVSRSYRIYVGLALAILLGLLVYITWRSNAAFWSNGTSPALPQAVPAPKPEPAAEPPATVSAQSNSETKTNSAADPAPAASIPQTKWPEQARPQETRRTERRAQVHPAPRTISAPANPGSGRNEQNGSEELATAEKYLDAAAGTARDSRQAASWLWKAVAKQNPSATLLLSDLYLRGDGVTKSCDQARLLLDAAARKGAPAAAERLRNLQAFGCR